MKNIKELKVSNTSHINKIIQLKKIINTSFAFKYMIFLGFLLVSFYNCL